MDRGLFNVDLGFLRALRVHPFRQAGRGCRADRDPCTAPCDFHRGAQVDAHPQPLADRISHADPHSPAGGG